MLFVFFFSLPLFLFVSVFLVQIKTVGAFFFTCNFLGITVRLCVFFLCSDSFYYFGSYFIFYYSLFLKSIIEKKRNLISWFSIYLTFFVYCPVFPFLISFLPIYVIKFTVCVYTYVINGLARYN